MIREAFQFGNKACGICGAEAPAYLLVMPAGDWEEDGAAKQAEAIAQAADVPFLLASFTVKDWNAELSPWPAPPAFGDEAFGDGAEETLRFIREELLPALRERYPAVRDLPVILGGYSLAGLFSLWSAYQTEDFAAAAAVSPSVWFPGWMDYARSHKPRTKAIYLSLGDKEERTRSRTMAAVGDNIRQMEELLREQSVRTILEWNPGNHFREPEVRCAKGFAWCMCQGSLFRRPEGGAYV